ncbi:MAG TPA: acetyl-CoA carboxylase carboxyltransferase subunit alpha [bacterium]|nr:acetyl-CoA carboxylase carboxyltransferase subunit alpha [bacterium]
MDQHRLEFEKPIFELRRKIDELKALAKDKSINVDEEVSKLEAKIAEMRAEIYKELTPWQIFQIMRHPKRPRTLDYIERIFNGFSELHGDRGFGDDKALVGGTARLEDRPVMVLGLQKGKDTKENILRNFGMAQPDGYRKALRLMKLAEKFGLPVITFIDTMGAFPGIEGEERGVAEAIAKNLLEMARLKVPVIISVIGEGGSGGALGIGVGDRVLMMKYAMYSVISFEGCAAILWKDSKRASDAAQALKPTAGDLLSFKVIDEIIEEPAEGAHTDPDFAAGKLKEALIKNLDVLMRKPVEVLLKERYEKFRNMGMFKKTGAVLPDENPA